MQDIRIRKYINSFSPEIQERLNSVYLIIKEVMPEATEDFSYQVPTFKINNKNAVHFGGAKNHISIYPTPQVIDFFENKLTNYKVSKGTIQFSNKEGLPLPLIREIVSYRKSLMS